MKRQYPNPPVVEALCEVYFQGSRWDPTIPGIFYERVRDRYPDKAERPGFQIELSVAPEVPAARAQQLGTRSLFSRSDHSQQLQLERDLLIINQLRPYPGFEEWKPIVTEAISLYKELAKPAGVSKIGMRYINRIEIPHQIFEMEDYFHLFVEIPEDLGAAHSTFMTRVVIPGVRGEIRSGHQLVVTLGSAPPQSEGSATLLLDLYDLTELASEGQVGAVERHLDDAHQRIERAFESIITDSTRRLFEEI